jgi:hypothetical protein
MVHHQINDMQDPARFSRRCTHALAWRHPCRPAPPTRRLTEGFGCVQTMWGWRGYGMATGRRCWWTTATAFSAPRCANTQARQARPQAAHGRHGATGTGAEGGGVAYEWY